MSNEYDTYEPREMIGPPLKVRGSLILHVDVRAITVDVLGHLSTRNNVETSKLKVSGDCTIGGYCQANQVINLGSLRVQSIQTDHIQSSGYLSVAENATTRSLYAEGSVRMNRLVAEDSIELRLGNRCTVKDMKSSGVITIKPSSMLLNILMRPFHKLTCGNIEGTDITLYRTVAELVRGDNIIIGEGCVIKEVHYSKSLTVDPKSQVNKIVLLK